MPTETKNSTANASRIGSASEAARTLNSDRPTTRPARNAPSAIDTPKTCADDTAMPRAMASTASVNSSRDCVRATCVSTHGRTRPPTTRVRPPRATTLTSASADRDRHGAAGRLREDRRHQHQHEHREQILDDQPADRDVPGRRVQLAVVREHADEDHGARDRQRHAEDDAGAQAPAGALDDERPDRGRDQALDDRAGDRDALHREQVLEVELQADAEHQQDHADLGELLGDVAIGDEPGRVRPDHQPGQEVADDRRQLQALGEIAPDERSDEAAGECEDQIEAVHAALWLGPRATMGRRHLAARGESPAAFDGRCIPALGVARRANIPDILPPRAWIAGRLVRLGATRHFHHGLLEDAALQAGGFECGSC